MAEADGSVVLFSCPKGSTSCAVYDVMKQQPGYVGTSTPADLQNFRGRLNADESVRHAVLDQTGTTFLWDSGNCNAPTPIPGVDN